MLRVKQGLVPYIYRGRFLSLSSAEIFTFSRDRKRPAIVATVRPKNKSRFSITSKSMTSESLNMASQLQCLGKGGPFKIVQVPKPSFATDQVLIRQRTVALNGLDWKQRDSGFMISTWPHILGIEGAGIIEAVGSEVKNLRVGDEVMAWMAGRAHGDDWGGSYQEYVVMPERYVARKPNNISIEEAASLP